MKMGDEYKCNNNNPQHQQQQLYHHRFHQRTTATATAGFLLPMLCRLSIKDVKEVKQQCKDRSPSSISKEDPSSPKVSCIGKVKRRNYSKIHVGFPTPNNLFISSSKNHAKLKRFFSGKNLNHGAAGDGEYSCRELLRRNTSARKSRKVNSSDDDVGVGVDVSELDPPLPVVKKMVAGEVKSLWTRRRSAAAAAAGASLKTLQIHLANNNQIIPPTTL